MLGYTIEGDLGDTGIEVRSEGAYIESTPPVLGAAEQEVDFFQGLVGADYAFKNGLNLTVEGLYSSKSFTYLDAVSQPEFRTERQYDTFTFLLRRYDEL